MPYKFEYLRHLVCNISLIDKKVNCKLNEIAILIFKLCYLLNDSETQDFVSLQYWNDLEPVAKMNYRRLKINIAIIILFML